MASDVILTLIINQAAYVAIVLIQTFNRSNCTKFLCGPCFEVDEYHPRQTTTQAEQEQISNVGSIAISGSQHPMS